MIPSLDTYVYDKLESSLKAILGNEQVLKLSLQGIDERARENFIGTYGGKNAKREINVTYSFPNGKEGFDALYLIQLGDSSPSSDSIGSAEGTYSQHTGNTVKELSEIKYDEDNGNLYIEVESPIAELDGIEGLSFASSDNVAIEDNRITFAYMGNESLVGIPVTIIYTQLSRVDDNTAGVYKGYTMEESVIITPLSTNLDTLRCLDALMKVILIIIRESVEEQTSMGLQRSRFEPIQVVDIPTEMPVYGRPLTLAYTLSYSLEFEFGTLLKEINIAKKPR